MIKGYGRVRSTDNFLAVPMTIDNVVHQSCEHYYQYAKFDADRASVLPHRERIRNASSGGAAWSLGQSRQHKLIDAFEESKYSLMYRAVRAKYHQHPALAAELAATGAAPIRAAASTSTWQHVNSLILTRVREELRATNGQPPLIATDDFAQIVRKTGGPDAFTQDDALVQGCAGTCEQCTRCTRRVIRNARPTSTTLTAQMDLCNK